MATDDYRMAGEYQFGHGSLAAERLAVLARVFRPSTEAFLRDAPLDGVKHALDLGCGPGHTTRLLAQRFPGAEVVGLDLSPEFLAEAKRESPAGVAYESCDVACDPLPGPSANLAFCRYLLSHLRQPRDVIATWGAALAPGGLVLAEELEAIHPRLPVYQQYLAIVTAMLADHGSELYVGPALAAGPDPGGLERCFDRVFQLRVPSRDAARMFAMNVPNWRDRPFIREHYATAEIDALGRELQRLAESDGGEPVLWELRQIGWRRRAVVVRPNVR